MRHVYCIGIIKLISQKYNKMFLKIDNVLQTLLRLFNHPYFCLTTSVPIMRSEGCGKTYLSGILLSDKG